LEKMEVEEYFQDSGIVKSKCRNVVIFLGWMGSTKRLRRHYVNLYTELGYDIFSIGLNEWEVATKLNKAADLLINRIFHVLDSNNNYPSILVHLCSNGGLFLYQKKKIQNKFKTNKEKYGKLQSAIVGIVLDSTPSRMTFAESCTAFTFGRNIIVKIIISTLIAILWTFYETIGWVLWIERARVFSGGFLRYSERETIKALGNIPQLYICGKQDKICHCDYTVDFAKKQISSGINTKIVCYEDSEHVAHLKKHPDEYKTEVTSFCAKIFNIQ